MNDEVWYPVKNYEGYYEITKTGMVRSLSKRNFHYIMEQRIDRAGYQTVRLQRKTDKGSTQFVHRLLAKTFIENPNAKKCVNHIDGNKLNNDLSNLEWVTHEENIKHAYSIGLMKKNSKPVVDNCSGMLFESIQEACNHSGIHRKTLIGYLNGNRRNPTCMEYMVAA